MATPLQVIGAVGDGLASAFGELLSLPSPFAFANCTGPIRFARLATNLLFCANV